MSVPLIRVHLQISEEFRPAECKDGDQRWDPVQDMPWRGLQGPRAADTALGQFWNPPQTDLSPLQVLQGALG